MQASKLPPAIFHLLSTDYTWNYTASEKFRFHTYIFNLFLNHQLSSQIIILSLSLHIFTGSIARSANGRYLIYSKADFEVFGPDGGDMLHWWGWNLAWRRGLVHSSMPNFTPVGATVRVQDPKTEIFTEIWSEIWNINAPWVSTPWAVFIKFAEFVPGFRTR